MLSTELINYCNSYRCVAYCHYSNRKYRAGIHLWLDTINGCVVRRRQYSIFKRHVFGIAAAGVLSR